MSIFKVDKKDQHQRRIHTKMDKIIKRVQKDLQMEQNFTKGKKARTVSYLDATLDIARRLKNGK